MSQPPVDPAKARLLGVFNASPDCVITTDRSLRALDVNRAAERILQWTAAEITGKNLGDLIVPAAQRGYHLIFAAVNQFAGADLFDRATECIVRRRDGSELPVELTICRLFLDTKDPVFVFHLQDIEQRKLSEAGLAKLQVDLEMRFAERAEALSTANLQLELEIAEGRRREQRQNATYRISEAALDAADLPALFEKVHSIIGELMPAANCYIALLNQERTLLTFPRFIDELAETPPSRRPGRGLTEYLIDSGKSLLATETDMEHLLVNAGYAPIGLRCKIWMGAPLMVAGKAIGAIVLQDYRNPRAYNEGHLRLLTFVAEQLAAAVQRKQADDARRAAEAAYRSIFENAPEGLYQTTPDGKFVRVNRALAQMFGYASINEMIEATNDISRQLYVDPKRRDEFFNLVTSTDEVSDFISEFYRRDGSRLWVSESVRVLRNPDHSIRLIEGVAVDITQQHEAAVALRDAKESADAANRAKSQFLASMSHELRTPLNGILGYTQILRRDPELKPKQARGISIIHDSAEHLLALINDVLDLSKIEARRLQINLTDFDLIEFGRSIEEMFQPRAREKSLRFAAELGTDLPRGVRGDEQRLRQVLLNLIGNAIKFTQQGVVIFSIRHVSGNRIRFSVSDSGSGIPPHELSRIFEPFTQLGDSRAQAAGTGLGLAISRSLVELMGGTLHVDSRPGLGSSFYFELPMEFSAAEMTRSRRALRRIKDYVGARKKILVVDDNPANREVLSDSLRSIGFEVATANSGEEALATFETYPADIVLMDLRMPGMGGLAATRTLREKYGEGLFIVAVSASAYDLDRRECLEAGCNDFLPKPMREEALWDLLERLLGVTWIYHDDGGDDAFSGNNTPAPSPQEADAIHELASAGDVIGIRQRMTALVEENPKMAPFAKAIIELAEKFKMKAIRQYVAPWRTNAVDSAGL
ncbi:MAG TPA: PAS domain S-box protein [Opitutaceae bacterium]|nr:PAS domain S-box protein [Opitutaceae bacterium]